MRAAVRTLKETFRSRRPDGRRARCGKRGGRNVFVIYAAETPFDPEALRQSLKRQGIENIKTIAMPESEQDKYVAKEPPIVLTDAYAPVDNLMASRSRSA